MNQSPESRPLLEELDGRHSGHSTVLQYNTGYPRPSLVGEDGGQSGHVTLLLISH